MKAATQRLHLATFLCGASAWMLWMAAGTQLGWAFLLALAAGAWWGGRSFGLQQAGVAVLAALAFVTFPVAILLPCAFLVGAGLPAMTRAGVSASRVWALMLLGAACGGFVAGFVLLPAFGFLRTGMVAAAVSGVSAVLAWRTESAEQPADSPSLGSAFFTGAAVTTLAGFWTQRLAIPLGESPYTLTTIAVTILAGLAMGSRIYSRVRLKWLPAMAAAALAGLVIGRWIPEVVFGLMQLFGGSFWGVTILRFLATSLVLLPAALLLGLLFAWCAVRGGRAYALHIAGAAAGVALALAATHVFPPSPIYRESVVTNFFNDDLYRSGLTLREIAATRTGAVLQRDDDAIARKIAPQSVIVAERATVEFYSSLRDKVVVQRAACAQLLPEDLALMARTMAAVFPVVSLWAADADHLLLVGSSKPAWPADPQTWAHFELGPADLRRFAGQGEVNTKDHPVLEYILARRRLRVPDSSVLSAVIAAGSEPLPVNFTAEQRLALAAALLRNGAIAESREVARPLFPVLRDRAPIWLYAGDLNRKLQKYDVAMNSYKQALDHGAGAAAWRGMGHVELETNHASAAEDDFRRALPDSAEDLARSIAAQDRAAEALYWQRQVVPPQPIQQANLYFRTGHGDLGEAMLRQVLAADPYSYGAHRLLADYFLATKRYAESAAGFQFLLRYRPLADPTMFDHAAEALLRTGDLAASDRALELGRRLFPPAAPKARMK